MIVRLLSLNTPHCDPKVLRLKYIYSKKAYRDWKVSIENRTFIFVLYTSKFHLIRRFDIAIVVRFGDRVRFRVVARVRVRGIISVT